MLGCQATRAPEIRYVLALDLEDGLIVAATTHPDQEACLLVFLCCESLVCVCYPKNPFHSYV